MKISIYIIFAIAFILNSCINNQNEEKNKNGIELKPIILEYNSQLEEYHNENDFDIRPEPKVIHIKKIISPEKTIYLYKYESYVFVDSLFFFKDSIKMNNEKLVLMNKRLIAFKGKSLEVKKYQYLDRSSNLFINDSLGLIMQKGQTHPYGTVVREYNTKEYRGLCNEIIKDSIFFSFEFDFKHLKEYIKLKK